MFRAIAEAFPGEGVRIDPNGAWSVETSIRIGQAIEDLPNDYFEDPCFGLEGMRRFDKHEALKVVFFPWGETK